VIEATDPDDLALVPGWRWSEEGFALERSFPFASSEAQLRFLLDAAGEAQEAGLSFAARPDGPGVRLQLFVLTPAERLRVLRFARSFEMLLLIGSERCAP
jgi:hypothetical protein